MAWIHEFLLAKLSASSPLHEERPAQSWPNMEFILLCSTKEGKSCGFETTWGCVNEKNLPWSQWHYEPSCFQRAHHWMFKIMRINTRSGWIFNINVRCSSNIILLIFTNISKIVMLYCHRVLLIWVGQLCCQMF